MTTALSRTHHRIEQCRRRAHRLGFTLIELVLVVAILAILMSLLLPAIQKVREAAQRTACANNVKQIGIALHNYASAYGELPPGGVDDSPRVHGWVPHILPYIEQQTLFNRYDWETSWNDDRNQSAVTMQLQVMQCPSADANRMDERKQWSAAAGDYGVLNEVHGKLRKDGLMEWVNNLEGVMWVIGPKEDHGNLAPRLSDIPDGTSTTILIAECAGRPEVWRAGALIPGKTTAGGGWADRNNAFRLDGVSWDGAQPYGPCAVNCTNANEVYSFHPAGANVLFADGSVHLISADVKMRTFAALVTRHGGETFSPKDFD